MSIVSVPLNSKRPRKFAPKILKKKKLPSLHFFLYFLNFHVIRRLFLTSYYGFHAALITLQNNVQTGGAGILWWYNNSREAFESRSRETMSTTKKLKFFLRSYFRVDMNRDTSRVRS